MSIKDNLSLNEEVVFSTTLHWIINFSFASVVTIGLYSALKRITTEFVITNKKVILKTGIIAQKIIEIDLQKIESIIVDQSILGRIFGFGTVTIVGNGGTNETLSDVDSPLKFRKAIQGLKE